MFYSIALKPKELNILDRTHISIDSIKMDTFAASKHKKHIIDYVTDSNWRIKRDRNGNKIRWFGWKLHILSDSKSELQLDILVTPANIYDGTVALSMIDH